MISHTHKFIFIHIPKCGGTSIERAFKIDAGKFDPNILTGRSQDTTWSTTGPGSLYHDWLQHTTLKEMQVNFKINTKDFFTFTCVRNPWDRLVSSFFYEQRFNSKLTSFKNFIKKPTYANNQHSLSQYEYVIDYKDRPGVDFIMRLETLQKDFDIACDKIGIARKELPHINKSKHKHYTEYYDEETREIVAEKYAKDIEYFGYEFD